MVPFVESFEAISDGVYYLRIESFEELLSKMEEYGIITSRDGSSYVFFTQNS
ncbi:MAG: hypothetical protein GF364_15605 [Candidatus Lokiarchaeota archaeon]|nr:hypothetical protein [Candidatus Lokiarchaeota archaeon]